MVKAETRRMFFALCPDDQVRQRIWKLSDDVQFGRRIPAENLHVTLVFMGLVSKEQGECLEQAASNIQPPHFTLHVDRLGYWVRPKVLWAGCTDVPDELLSLVRQLQESTASCGFSQNLKPPEPEFSPHVTLARKVNAVQGNQYCEQYQVTDVIEWEVHHFSLMESVTGAEGPVYKVLRSW